MKKIFGKWNIFEIIILIASIIGIVLVFVFTEDKNYISLFSSFFGIVSVIFSAKQLLIAPITNVVFNILYIIVSYSQQYYGEVIVYAFIITPLFIMTIINWFAKRNPNEQATVKVGSISKKEAIIAASIALPFTVGMFFLLRALGTANLIVSTITLIFSSYGTYFCFRRCPIYPFLYLINAIMSLVLWIISVVNYGMTYLPMVINFAIIMLLNIYSIFNWIKAAKKQKNEEVAQSEK